MKSIFSILVISGLAACSPNLPIKPTGSVSNGTSEAAVFASSPICRSVRSSFFGGGEANSTTSINAIAVGNNGNVYVAGTTNSPRIPGTQNQFQPSINPKAFSSAFVAEFSGDLRTLIAATYFGRTGVGEGRALAIGRDGQIYVGGQMDWERTFVAELTPDLKTLQNFILAKAEPIRAMAVAPNGDVYVAGGGSVDASGYAYVVKYSSDLYQLGENPVLGGSGRNWANAIVVAPTGEVYVAGGTTSSDFPMRSGGAQPVYPSTGFRHAGSVAFVVELSSDLKKLMQSTYFGGNGETEPTSLVLAKQGQIYLSGYTYSTNLPGTNGATQPKFAGGSDAYVTELSSNLTSIVRTTYLGGARDDWAWAMAASDNDQIYVAGTTNSSNFPDVTGGVQGDMARGFIIHPMHGFISKLSENLERVIQSSYYIGTDYNGHSYEEIRGIALGANNYLYLTGYTQSTSLPCDQLGASTNFANRIYGGFVARYPNNLRKRLDNELP